MISRLSGRSNCLTNPAEEAAHARAPLLKRSHMRPAAGAKQKNKKTPKQNNPAFLYISKTAGWKTTAGLDGQVSGPTAGQWSNSRSVVQQQVSGPTAGRWSNSRSVVQQQVWMQRLVVQQQVWGPAAGLDAEVSGPV